MNKILTMALSALMVLALFAMVSPASAEEHTVDEIEIRGPVFSGNFSTSSPYDANDILESNATNFAGFFYDIDEGQSGETLTIYINGTTDDRKLDEDGNDSLIYEASVFDTPTDTEFNFTKENDDSAEFKYEKLGFLAEEYVPLVDDNVDKITKLLMDDDTSHTVRTGETIELEEGYAITPQQIDVDGNKVWLELTKDGEFVDDKIISTDTSATNEKTWYYEQDVAGEDDVLTLMIHIDEVFQGQVDSLAVIEGIWQIAAEDVEEIEVDDEYGKMIVDSVGDSTISMSLDESITLNADDTYDIMENLKFKVADSDELRFYLMKQITEPGTYEIRGTVAENATATDPVNWTATGQGTGYSFAGFWYDLADDRASESLLVQGVNGTDRKLDPDASPTPVYYNTSLVSNIDTEFNFSEEDTANEFNYEKIGLFAEEYVPLVDGNADKLTNLLMDDDTSHTVRTGDSIELGEGYAITPQQIDVDGNKVWLELTKDGEFVDDKIINTDDDADKTSKTWYYEQDVAGEDDVLTLMIHVDEVFQGQVDSLAVIEGIWQIAAEDVQEFETDDEFGNLVVDSVTGGQITMSLDDSITLDEDDTYSLTDGISFRVADDEKTLRFFPYVERTIAGEEEPEEDMPTAAFSASPMSGNVPLEVTFTDESENAENYEWDFGNGETSTDANPTTTYEEAGEYTVTLTVSNDAGEDTAEETITVNPEGTPEEPEMPTADFSANTTSGTAPLTVEFTDNSENAENYEWDFGNGETSTEANPTVTYEEADEYTVTLTVSNDAGEDTAETTITVEAAEEPGDGEETPGFEAVFAIAGLLAIAFLVRRNRN